MTPTARVSVSVTIQVVIGMETSVSGPQRQAGG
jgi:hypothetical protein